MPSQKYEHGKNNEELLKANQELYKICVSEHGEGNKYAIRAGRSYAKWRQLNY
jgi:hypothetical protein